MRTPDFGVLYLGMNYVIFISIHASFRVGPEPRKETGRTFPATASMPSDFLPRRSGLHGSSSGELANERVE